MKVNAYKCDYCGRETTSESAGENGWVEININEIGFVDEKITINELKQFCSEKHLFRFIMETLDEIDEKIEVKVEQPITT